MGGTLLLADDSITIQKVVELTFAETDHNVVAVGSGRDLFKRLPDVKPDVVLCDVVMPDVNGYEVCQTLKSDPATLHIPVVLLTGTFEPFDRDRALAAGCDAIVTKPFEARELIDVVEDLIKRAKSLPPAVVGDVLGEHGIPDGVAAIDFTTTGFEDMVPRPEQPPAIPEDGIDLTSSALGDSNPQVARPAPPELQEPPAPPAFPLPGEPEQPFPEPVIVAVVPAGERTPARPEPLAPAAKPPLAAVPREFVEPFAVVAPPPPVPEPIGPAPSAPVPLESAAVFPPEELASLPGPAPAPAIESGPTQRILVQAVVPPPPAPAPAAPLSESEIERIARRAAELVPPAPAPPTVAELLGDEHVERIAARAVQLVPPPPTASELLTDEHVQRIAARAVQLVPPPPTASDLLTDEHVQRIATRAVQLVPPPPSAAELLTDEHVDRIARRAAELVPPPPVPVAPAEFHLTDEQVDRIARRVVELAGPQLERIAWEVLPDMAEMLVRKRIAELEAAAEEDN